MLDLVLLVTYTILISRVKLFCLIFFFLSITNARMGELMVDYYSKSCPNAEKIIKDQVLKLYDEHGNTAVSWVRNLFHDCMVKVFFKYITCIP